MLRGVPGKVPAFKRAMDELTLGNVYPTTLHVINAALGLLSALSACQVVYRGMAGGLLPATFVNVNEEDGFRGGVEYGFMSTTTDRKVAEFYAQGGNGLLFEIFMGLVDKGAMLDWMSQYPHEAEICFPPLTALEVRGTRIKGSMTIVEVDARVVTNRSELDFETAADGKPLSFELGSIPLLFCSCILVSRSDVESWCGSGGLPQRRRRRVRRDRPRRVQEVGAAARAHPERQSAHGALGQRR